MTAHTPQLAAIGWFICATKSGHSSKRSSRTFAYWKPVFYDDGLRVIELALQSVAKKMNRIMV